LPTNPRFAGSYPAEDNRFLREIKIRSAKSFEDKVKPSISGRKILRHDKERYEYERDTSQAKFTDHFFATFMLRY
jgi:ribosomal 50S subunit-associated protein YjgA (DUF615 family)